MVHTEGENNRIEIWKDIIGYKNLYQGSNLGRVKSFDTYRKGKNGSIRFYKGRILKPSIDSKGYLQVDLWKNGKRKTCLVHRITAEAFLEIPEELRHLKGTRYLQVNHKDENKLNNNVENLEYCSAKYNNTYGTRIERAAEKNTNGKLSKPILQYTLDGKFVREWPSTMQAEREGGFNHGHIAACCKGKKNKHHNFIWRYK